MLPLEISFLPCSAIWYQIIALTGLVLEIVNLIFGNDLVLLCHIIEFRHTISSNIVKDSIFGHFFICLSLLIEFSTKAANPLVCPSLNHGLNFLFLVLLKPILEWNFLIISSTKIIWIIILILVITVVERFPYGFIS